MFRDRRAWLITFFTGGHLWLCTAYSAFMLAMPPGGITGVEVCMLKHTTGGPCPGCGMTRSGANLFRGDVRRALNYHPFGPVVVPLIVFSGILALLPRTRRRVVADFLARWTTPVFFAYLSVIILFLCFGAVRWVAVLSGLWLFPTEWF